MSLCRSNNEKNDNFCGGKSKHNSLRVAGSFTAIHYPWTKEDPMPDLEYKFYIKNDKLRISTWI